MALEISILKGKQLERDGCVRFLYNFKIFGAFIRAKQVGENARKILKHCTVKFVHIQMTYFSESFEENMVRSNCLKFPKNLQTLLKLIHISSIY